MKRRLTRPGGENRDPAPGCLDVKIKLRSCYPTYCRPPRPFNTPKSRPGAGLPSSLGRNRSSSADFSGPPAPTNNHDGGGGWSVSLSAMWSLTLTFLPHHIGDGQDMTAGRRPRAHDSHHSPPPMAPIMTLGCLTAPRVAVQIMFSSLQTVTATGSGAARESGPKVSKGAPLPFSACGGRPRGPEHRS